ncbi:MAG TPA: ATP-binding cassette domain-containing protein [Steroidobacteraceae bacterium]|jgi:molybdate transport system ATP-binding protein|nr:ATP-binding cassette domain-containing protein [Steroidobacteraceae bacterium]
MSNRARANKSSLALTLRRIDLDRGERAVLRDVNWRIGPGQRWLLIGGNGAGKTQLLKLVAGSVWPKPTGRELRRYRWRGETFDNPAGVQEEIAYVGAERQDRYEHYEWNFRAREVVGTGVQRTDIPMRELSATENSKVTAIFKRLDIGALAERRFLTLSYGERRLVLIARALASRPRLLLLDEVANGLDARNHARFLQWLNRNALFLAVPWVFATHRSSDVPDSMTHLLELEKGAVKRSGAMRAGQARELLQQDAREFLSRKSAVRTRARRRKVLVALRNADVYVDEAHILTGIDLEVRAGDCWVVHGPNGSGKSTLLRTLYGDHGVASHGSIVRAGIVPGVPLEKFKLRTAYVAPHLQTWHKPAMSVMEVVASGRYASIGLNDSITRGDRQHAERALRRFGMFALRARTLAEMSYGQARRILFARAWAREPMLALLDEPFAGLDRATRADLTRRLNRWLAEGGSCVIATHHREEWPAHTTHVLELKNGRGVSNRAQGET